MFLPLVGSLYFFIFTFQKSLIRFNFSFFIIWFVLREKTKVTLLFGSTNFITKVKRLHFSKRLVGLIHGYFVTFDNKRFSRFNFFRPVFWRIKIGNINFESFTTFFDVLVILSSAVNNLKILGSYNSCTSLKLLFIIVHNLALRIICTTTIVVTFALFRSHFQF